jgi:hypothetical protein
LAWVGNQYGDLCLVATTEHPVQAATPIMFWAPVCGSRFSATSAISRS